MIQAVKGCTAAEAEKYEIVWHVIKLQHRSGWFGTTEWHIDGIIKEKAKISINYYGNGNTSGNAPLGTADHIAGEPYTVLSKNTMVKKINGVEVAFLGWSAKADGTGEEAGFYQPGAVINPTKSISLYAMWDTTTQYTATVNTYLDNVLTDDSDIHGTTRELYLGTEGHYYQLTRSGEGVYTAKITGNGKFHLFSKDPSGTYTQIGTHQLTIYNQNASLDVHHYSVAYDAAGGSFAVEPGKQTYYYGDPVTAITEVPVREGYRFQGWKAQNGGLIQSGGAVTGSIDAPITLVARWEKTVKVTINVTINHEGGNGYDQVETKDNVSVALVSRANDSSPYLEVEGKAFNLDKGKVPEDQKVTRYTDFTYTDMPGGEVDYTVVASKSGYDTKITPSQDADGNWIIDVVMNYKPSNFDVEFTVEVDQAVPERYIPDAAIVKVTFWSTDRNQWEIITQQEGGLPGVRVDLDPKTRSGSGSYPVWKYESNGTTPYGYRIQVTSFVYPDGTIVPASQVVTQDVAWTDNVYTATVQNVTGGQKYGTLNGAYIDDATNAQKGTLKAVITMDLHNVTFDAQGGKVNGQNTQTVTEQYKVPGFQDYAHIVTNDVMEINRHHSYLKTFLRHPGKVMNRKYGVGICLRNLLRLGNVHVFTGFQDLHLPSPYLKQTFLDVWSAMPEVLDRVSRNRFRPPFDVSQSVFRYWQLASGQFCPVSPASRGRYWSLSHSIDRAKAILNDPNIKMVCVNDVPSDVDFEQAMEQIVAIFDRKLPNKSAFEK